MRIAIGGIVHERWTIPLYLEALDKLDTRGIDAVRTFVVDGDLTEGCWDVGGEVVYCELSGPHYRRQKSNDRAIYGRMATLRNILRELALGMDCDALLSVDSDIIVQPDLLQRLVATVKPWVAPLVRNDVDGTNPRGHWNVFKLRGIERDAGLVDHFLPMGPGWPKEEVLGWDPRDPKREECLAAGAVCLYHRELLEKVRWGTDERGRQEDIGFAMAAFKAGFRASYIPVRLKHLTVDGLEEG